MHWWIRGLPTSSSASYSMKIWAHRRVRLMDIFVSTLINRDVRLSPDYRCAYQIIYTYSKFGKPTNTVSYDLQCALQECSNSSQEW
jgi:hypothetical protein